MWGRAEKERTGGRSRSECEARDWPTRSCVIRRRRSEDLRRDCTLCSVRLMACPICVVGFVRALAGLPQPLRAVCSCRSSLAERSGWSGGGPEERTEQQAHRRASDATHSRSQRASARVKTPLASKKDGGPPRK